MTLGCLVYFKIHEIASLFRAQYFVRAGFRDFRGFWGEGGISTILFSGNRAKTPELKIY
jgi:hypothetical protein